MATTLAIHEASYQDNQKRILNERINNQFNVINSPDIKAEDIFKLVYERGNSALSLLTNVKYDVLVQVLKNQPYGLAFLEDSQISQELANLSVAKYGPSITYVPTKFLTKELCMVALKKHIHSIVYIPEELLDEEMILELINTKKSKESLLDICSYLFRLLPESLKTPAICELSVRNYGYNIIYVPVELRTDEMRKYAMESIEELGPEGHQWLPCSQEDK